MFITWNSNWLMTIYLFLWNLKMVCKSPYKIFVFIWTLFEVVVMLYSEKRLSVVLVLEKLYSALTLITSPSLKQTKSENNNLWDHLSSYRLSHIRSFFFFFLDIIHRFRLDPSVHRIWYTHIQLYFTHFIKKWNGINYLQ